jgi:hypothetical protein
MTARRRRALIVRHPCTVDHLQRSSSRELSLSSVEDNESGKEHWVVWEAEVGRWTRQQTLDKSRGWTGLAGGKPRHLGGVTHAMVRLLGMWRSAGPGLQGWTNPPLSNHSARLTAHWFTSRVD